MIYLGYKDKSRRQLALTTAVSKTNGLLGALACMVMISSQLSFVNFRWGKDNEIWLFLMLPSSQPGSARADDANAEEAAVDMDHGNAARYLTGNPAVMTTLPVVGKRTIRLQFPPVVLIPCPIARFSASPVIRTLILMVAANENGAGLSRSTT